jgi:hemoglobin
MSERDASAFAAVGGEAGVRALVDTFYHLMDSDPRYAQIRSLHPPDLSGSRDKLFWFLCGWLGGPAHYVERFGHPRLRARHLPFSIGIAERDQWMHCMGDALSLCKLPADLIGRLVEAFHSTADWMRNRPG